MCVSGLQAVGSCINHLTATPTVVLPAFTQVDILLTHQQLCVRNKGGEGKERAGTGRKISRGKGGSNLKEQKGLNIYSL